MNQRIVVYEGSTLKEVAGSLPVAPDTSTLGPAVGDEVGVFVLPETVNVTVWSCDPAVCVSDTLITDIPLKAPDPRPSISPSFVALYPAR